MSEFKTKNYTFDYDDAFVGTVTVTNSAGTKFQMVGTQFLSFIRHVCQQRLAYFLFGLLALGCGSPSFTSDPCCTPSASGAGAGGGVPGAPQTAGTSPSGTAGAPSVTGCTASRWAASASTEGAALGIDGKLDTAWTTGVAQEPGDWFEVSSMGGAELAGIRLVSTNDEPGQLIRLWVDGVERRADSMTVESAHAIDYYFEAPRKADKVRVELRVSSAKAWAVSEFQALCN